LLEGFNNFGYIWIVGDRQDDSIWSTYIDEKSAKEAIKQLQDDNPDKFFYAISSLLETYVGVQEEGDMWL
jgi:hypothetical protein